jgi:Spy/CpxP family protein refolding chaperone
MGTGAPGGMMGARPPAINPAPPSNRGTFGRPPIESRGQPRMGLQLGPTGRWWDDHGTAKKLNLSSDQQRRMDTVFEANWPTITNLYTNLQHEEINLGSLSNTDLRDETKVFAAIDRVAHARSDLEKEYAHTFLQIRQQLDPQQLETLDKEIASSH